LSEDNTLVQIRPGEDPNPDLVKMLQGWLALAKSGEMRGIIMAAEMRGGVTRTAYEIGDGHWRHLIGALDLTKHHMLSDLVDGGDEVED